MDRDGFERTAVAAEWRTVEAGKRRDGFGQPRRRFICRFCCCFDGVDSVVDVSIAVSDVESDCRVDISQARLS